MSYDGDCHRLFGHGTRLEQKEASTAGGKMGSPSSWATCSMHRENGVLFKQLAAALVVSLSLSVSLPPPPSPNTERGRAELPESRQERPDRSPLVLGNVLRRSRRRRRSHGSLRESLSHRRECFRPGFRQLSVQTTTNETGQPGNSAVLLLQSTHAEVWAVRGGGGVADAKCGCCQLWSYLTGVCCVLSRGDILQHRGVGWSIHQVFLNFQFGNPQ